MEEFKNNKFVIAPTYLVEDRHGLIILTDVGFWSKHVDELIEWCNENNCVVQGMTVVPESDQALTAFCLKWA